MSITITATILITDFEVLKETTEELGYTLYENETEILLHETVEYGYPVYIPGWRYPVVITKNGEVKYDNNNGLFGKQEYLDLLLQTYSEKKTIKEIKNFAKENGYQIQEENNTFILIKENEKIEIEIEKQNITIDAKGFKGEKCINQIEKLNIPMEIKEKTLKDEYNQKFLKTLDIIYPNDYINLL